METTRRVGVAVDFSPCSNKALKWAVDNVVRDGDHLILVTIRPDGDYENGEIQLWAVTGSRNYSLPTFDFIILCLFSKVFSYPSVDSKFLRNYSFTLDHAG
ncbi:hypothetical protein L6164_013657 [Bauhinia variegata]|uniref:Uncharacterized protein n=1 Tax=Bauhinia variegata TaxID=167791 RepID=A0ACB9NER3_BAUVA|nr:hypothetical protein L6164_013657 [Bauhinia variegata]